MGLLSFLYFFIGSKFDNSFNIIWWSALLAFILQIPPKAKKVFSTEEEKNKVVDGMYNELGIKNGRLKYRIGLAFYVIGGILGWVLFYGKIVAIN